MNKILIYIFFLIFSTTINAKGTNHYRPNINYIVGGKIKIGELMPKEIIQNKLKYFSNDELVLLSNKKQDEFAIIDFCCGGFGEIQRITVSDTNPYPDAPINKINISSFFSEKSIHLGDTREKLFKTFGFPSVSKKENRKNIYFYLLDENNKFVARYNMSAYYEKYTFYKNKLISIEFGFEYP